MESTMIDVVAQYTLVGATSVIGFLIAMLVGILAWIFKKAIQDTTEELKALRASDVKLAEEVAAMRAELPEKYVGKADSYEFRKEMRESIRELSDIMRQGFESLRKEKADK